jgi:hypothetical protein
MIVNLSYFLEAQLPIELILVSQSNRERDRILVISRFPFFLLDTHLRLKRTSATLYTNLVRSKLYLLSSHNLKP